MARRDKEGRPTSPKVKRLERLSGVALLPILVVAIAMFLWVIGAIFPDTDRTIVLALLVIIGASLLCIPAYLLNDHLQRRIAYARWMAHRRLQAQEAQPVSLSKDEFPSGEAFEFDMKTYEEDIMFPIHEGKMQVWSGLIAILILNGSIYLGSLAFWFIFVAE